MKSRIEEAIDAVNQRAKDKAVREAHELQVAAMATTVWHEFLDELKKRCGEHPDYFLLDRCERSCSIRLPRKRINTPLQLWTHPQLQIVANAMIFTDQGTQDGGTIKFELVEGTDGGVKLQKQGRYFSIEEAAAEVLVSLLSLI